MLIITTIKQGKARSVKQVMKVNQLGNLTTEAGNLPQAGNGACRKCSCKKYVPETNRSFHAITAHQAYPCGNCGHDIRDHSS